MTSLTLGVYEAKSCKLINMMQLMAGFMPQHHWVAFTTLRTTTTL